MNDFESYQDEMIEARILSDAELLKDGAHIRLGRLVISEYQFEKARLMRDPLFDASIMGGEEGLEYTDVWPEAPNSHPELDKGAAEAWKQAYPHEDSKVEHVLQRHNIATIRDLLVIGREKTSTIRGFGAKTIERIGLMLESETPIAWKEVPTVQDIAEFCDTIDQISLLAVASIAEWHPMRLTISQALAIPPDKRVEALGQGTFSYLLYLQEQQAKNTYSTAEVFALQFDEAKHGMWTDPTQFE